MTEKEYMKKAFQCFAKNGFNPMDLIPSGIEMVIYDGFRHGRTPEAVVETYKKEHRFK